MNLINGAYYYYYFHLQQDDTISYISDCLKDKTQMSCFQKDRFGGDGNGISYW